MNPYPGLRPFRPSEAHLFCGREVVDSLLETRVRVSPLTVLFARSGVGKSSFLICRFLPRANKGSDALYLNEWGNQSPDTLINETLRSMVQKKDDEREEKPLLVMDQFEDVFKLDCERLRIWECLADWVNISEPPVHVLISMREEWLGAWGEASDYIPGSFGTMVRLTPLTSNELRRAIMRPASIEGTIQVNAELAEQILIDLKKPNAFGMGMEYVEPGMLQLVCQRLWNEAAVGAKPTMDRAVYASLGGADKIARDFVWHELRRAGQRDAYLSELDRVLWVGLTRHLSIAQGVKSIVSAPALSRKLRTEDLGIAGPAALDYELTSKERKYLHTIPEKRGDPPLALVNWIARVLNLGASAGFLKCQRGISVNERLYELSHDALSPFLQQFSIEFESWIRARWITLFYGLIGVVGLGPFFIVCWIVFGLSKTLLYTILVAFFSALYLGTIWLMMKALKLVLETLTFPLMRLLCKGDPRSRTKRPKGV